MAASIGEKKKVVVVGGGVAGSYISKLLEDHADVSLIDEKEYFEITWAGLRTMVEPAVAERALINHRDFLHKTNIIASTAVDIDGNQVVTAQGHSVPYDYLVIATGHTNSGGYTKTEKIKHYQTEYEKIKSANSILVVGGGPTGVELAAEIIVDFPDKKVTLVHRGARLLEFIGKKAGKKALDWLVSKKVEVLLGQSVNLNSASGGVYSTSNGETIYADCHFLCTGTPLGSSWLKKTILKNCLNEQGRLMVDPNMRVKGHDNIFAIGDVTDIPELKQAYSAKSHALVTVANLKILMKGKEVKNLSTYSPAKPLALVSLGRREGIMQVMCFTLSGRIPERLSPAISSSERHVRTSAFSHNTLN